MCKREVHGTRSILTRCLMPRTNFKSFAASYDLSTEKVNFIFVQVT